MRRSKNFRIIMELSMLKKNCFILLSLLVGIFGTISPVKGGSRSDLIEKIRRYDIIQPRGIEELMPRIESPKFRNYKELRKCVPVLENFQVPPTEQYKRELIAQVKYYVKVDFCLLNPFLDNNNFAQDEQKNLKFYEKDLVFKEIEISGIEVVSKSEVVSYLSEYFSSSYDIDDLIELTNLITLFYAQKGFLTSYASIQEEGILNHVSENRELLTNNTRVEIAVKETGLADIKYEGLSRKERELISKKIKSFDLNPLNIFDLVGIIQELRKYPDLSNLEAELKATEDLEYTVVLFFRKNPQLLKENAEQYYQRANNYFENNEYLLALEQLNKAIEINPIYSQAYTRKAEIYLKQDNYNQSISVLNEILSWLPNDHNTIANRAKVYAFAENWDKAMLDYNRAIELNPEFAQAYLERGELSAKMGDNVSAFDDYSKAIELGYNSEGVFNNRANLYVKQNKLSEALLDFNRAIDIAPNLAILYQNRGLIYAKQKIFSLALRDFERAVELDPFNGANYKNKGLVYEKIGEHQKALNNYSKAIAADPNDPVLFLTRGIFLARYTSAQEQAKDDLMKALELFEEQNKIDDVREVEAILEQLN